MYQHFLLTLRAKFLARQIFLDFITFNNIYVKLTEFLNFLKFILYLL